MTRKYLLFDLDETLTDPALGITNSVIHALKAFQIEVKERKDLFVFIGPPLFDSFVQYYHMSEKQADKAVELYREYFSVKGLFENSVYEGMATTLETLKKQGYHLAVATSKPEPYAIQILEHFKLDYYFDVICGSDLYGRKEDKADVIQKVINYFQDSKMSNYLMIGDRLHDALGAKKHHMDCLGVTYGYGSKEELDDAGCIATVDSNQAIIDIVKLI